MNIRSTIGALVLVLLCICNIQAQVHIGKQVPDFSLPDTDGNNRALDEFKGKYIVLEWTNPECPFTKKQYSTHNMQNLQSKYTQKGVAWLVICSSAPHKQGNHTKEEWKDIIQKEGINATCVLIDDTGTIGKLYDAKTTPQMFIVNPQGFLVYQGAIDNMPGVDPEEIKMAKNYVQEALDEALQGKPITIKETTPYGCSVKY